MAGSTNRGAVRYRVTARRRPAARAHSPCVRCRRRCHLPARVVGFAAGRLVAGRKTRKCEGVSCRGRRRLGRRVGGRGNDHERRRRGRRRRRGAAGFAVGGRAAGDVGPGPGDPGLETGEALAHFLRLPHRCLERVVAVGAEIGKRGPRIRLGRRSSVWPDGGPGCGGWLPGGAAAGPPAARISVPTASSASATVRSTVAAAGDAGAVAAGTGTGGAGAIGAGGVGEAVGDGAGRDRRANGRRGCRWCW